MRDFDWDAPFEREVARLAMLIQVEGQKRGTHPSRPAYGDDGVLLRNHRIGLSGEAWFGMTMRWREIPFEGRPAAKGGDGGVDYTARGKRIDVKSTTSEGRWVYTYRNQCRADLYVWVQVPRTFCLYLHSVIGVISHRRLMEIGTTDGPKIKVRRAALAPAEVLYGDFLTNFRAGSKPDPAQSARGSRPGSTAASERSDPERPARIEPAESH